MTAVFTPSRALLFAACFVATVSSSALAQSVRAGVRPKMPQVRAVSSNSQIQSITARSQTSVSAGGGVVELGGGYGPGGGGVIVKRGRHTYMYTPPYGYRSYSRSGRYGKYSGYGGYCGYGGYYDSQVWWNRSGMYGFLPYGYWRGCTTYDGPALIEEVRRVDPALLSPQSSADVVIPEPPDPAFVALLRGDFNSAAEQFAARALNDMAPDQQSPNASDTSTQAAPQSPPRIDRTNLRLTAFALVGASELDRAARACATAYRDDPALAQSPLNGTDLLGSPLRVRTLVNRAVAYANRAPSYDSWFLVAVLMQSEGRDDMARKMLERAATFRQPPSTN